MNDTSATSPRPASPGARLYAGDAATMELYPSKEDPIGEILPFKLIEDLNANNAR
jgi:hypothetical protein